MGDAPGRPDLRPEPSGSTGPAGLVAGANAVGAIAQEDRRLRETERLHTRPPRAPDLDRAPAPSEARRRRLRRRLIGVVVAEASLVLAIVAFLVSALIEDPFGADGPGWWAYLVACLGLVGFGADLAMLWRTLQRLPDPGGLPRSLVTVLGFTGQGNVDVVFAPGVLSVADLLVPVPLGAPGAPDAPGRADPPTAFVTRLGRRLGELIPGDILVCDGEPTEGAVVALASEENTDWTTALRVLAWSEIRAPSFREVFADSWREARAQAHNEISYPGARRGGRRPRVRQPDGSLQLPDPATGPTPPWGTR